jgi:predicted alpha/beta hydrolase family esterase
MRVAEAEILIVPGLGGSGEDHWQTRWEAKLSTARRVEQDGWDAPALEAWTDRLVAEVAASERPVVLVAHSLGVLTVAHAAGRFPAGKVAAAFLVAPPSDATVREIAAVDPAFAPAPRAALPFPSLVVASRDDAMAPYEHSEALARDWGATLVDAGSSGHINAESGHGPWPEGLMRFGGLLAKI